MYFTRLVRSLQWLPRFTSVKTEDASLACGVGDSQAHKTPKHMQDIANECLAVIVVMRMKIMQRW